MTMMMITQFDGYFGTPSFLCGVQMILESVFLLETVPSEHPKLALVVLDQAWIQVSHKTQS